MRYSLINPAWSFENSIYFGCQEPHFPVEYGYARELLQREGHEVQVLDAHMFGLSLETVKYAVGEFHPDFIVVTTAPSYLFWRCAPPELRVPKLWIDALRGAGGKLVCVGPHASTTPRTTLAKMAVDVVVLGECEEVLPRLSASWSEVPSIAYREGDAVKVNGGTHASNMDVLPALHWDSAVISRHSHHHHRFDTAPTGAGAEMETSRGCPYHCTFCAKDNFRNAFRRRPLRVIAEELDGLTSNGVEYVYFIDEIFLPYRDVLSIIAGEGIKFGIQTRIDLWSKEMLDLLGEAGCVSIEAGVESITEAGRSLLQKKCRLTTPELTERLIYAKRQIPFVQANLLGSEDDAPDEIETWRLLLNANGVWSNKPVPLFPYPGSPEYTLRWGVPDERAWERAHEFYLNRFEQFSDIQTARPSRLVELETSGSRGTT